MKGWTILHTPQSIHWKIIGLRKSDSRRKSTEKYAMGAPIPFRTANTRPSGNDPTHQLLRGAIIVALALSLVLYFVGLSEGRGELETLRANNAKQREHIQTQLVALETLSQIMAARDWLYRSTIELDRSNFGPANRDIEKAGSIFHSVHPASMGIDPARIQALQKEIATMTIPVRADRHAVHHRILRWIKQVDALLPRQVSHVDVR